MDGLSDISTWAEPAGRCSSPGALQDAEPGEAALQFTLASSIDCTGVGLHSGRAARLTLRPAPPDTGIVFSRTDLDRPSVVARYDRVVDTCLCTAIGGADWRIGTIEHLMAALAGVGIDNVFAEVDGPELPILDGSAEAFVFLIDCAGRASQAVPRRVIDILRPVRVEQGEAWAELRPHAEAGRPGLDVAMTICFSSAAIGRQSASVRLGGDAFRQELASARTFTMAGEVARLRSAGLALGGGLHNAVVVDGDRVLNPGGLRMPTEFVRHKLLDAVGDLALAGHALRGRFTAYRGGHALTNGLLHALFADPTQWRLSPAAASGWRQAA